MRRGMLALLLIAGHLLAADPVAPKPAVVLDDQQRVIQVTQTDGHVWMYSRDQHGWIISVMTGIGERWDLTYGPNGTIVIIVSPKGLVDLADATAVWNNLQLVLKRKWEPKQVLLGDPSAMPVH